MFKFFRFIYNMVYIDRRPSRLALKLFVGRMATFEKTGMVWYGMVYGIDF